MNQCIGVGMCMLILHAFSEVLHKPPKCIMLLVVIFYKKDKCQLMKSLEINMTAAFEQQGCD